MVIFKNADYYRFISESKDKRIILFGAGGTLDDFLSFNGNISILSKIDFILDNNVSASGKRKTVCSRELTVMTVDSFLAQKHSLDNYAVLLLLANRHVLNVVKQLDSIPVFDGVPCYYGLTALQWGHEMYPPLPVHAELPKSGGQYKIPKIIHYCWFGEKPIPRLERECIESWSKHCPDYEIRFWNESNYDIADAPLYVQQAYKAKKYAFVSDYVRLDVVFKYGGVYFDTDVELFEGINRFLNYKAVFAYLTYNWINTGLFFGSVANCETVKILRDMYRDLSFVKGDGSYELTSCPLYITDYFRCEGISINNSLHVTEDILFLPSDYFSPFTGIECTDGLKHLVLYMLTQNTVGIHKCASSWFEDKEYDSFEQEKQNYKDINERLLSDWKRKKVVI